MTNSDRQAARAGMTIIDGTADNTALSYDYMIPREDTTLTSMTATNDAGDTVDLKTDKNWDGTLLVTDYLVPPAGYWISQIKLATGSVQAF